MMKHTYVGLAALASGIAIAGCSREFDPSGEIGLVSREDGSGTRSAFIELTGVQTKAAHGKKIDRTSPTTMVASSTAVALTTVSGDPAALGYLSLGSINDSVKVLTVDGVAPTREEIAAGRYALVHPFNVVTPCMEKLKEAYCATHPNVTVEVQQSDSSTCVSDAKDGVCDLGMASRALKDSEKGAGLVATAIALDGLAVVVNPQNPIENISKESLRKAFMGEITAWNQVK